MSKPDKAIEFMCPHCGGTVRPKWKTCWLCSQPLAPGDAVPCVGRPSQAESEASKLAGGIVMGVTAFVLLSLLFGIAQSEGIEAVLVFMICFTPAFVITLTKTLRPRESEKPLSMLQMTTTFILWSMGTAALLVGIVISALVALYARVPRDRTAQFSLIH